MSKIYLIKYIEIDEHYINKKHQYESPCKNPLHVPLLIALLKSQTDDQCTDILSLVQMHQQAQLWKDKYTKCSMYI